MMFRLTHSHSLLSGAIVAAVMLSSIRGADLTPDQAANMLLDSARRACNEKNYSFAAGRFREFLTKYGNHKQANSAHYGLGLCLIEGIAKDYGAAVPHLQTASGDKKLPEHPFVLYYLGRAQRGLGTQALAQADAKPVEANRHRLTAQQRFEEASRNFAAAVAAFTDRIPKAESAEWAARARCDQAEMLLRLRKAKEARDAVAGFVQDAKLKNNRYRNLGLYYHGFACFLLKDHFAAGRSLSLLTPFSDPLFGTHARYLLARVHHADGERQEAREQYQGVLDDHNKQKQAAIEAIKQPDRFKDNPEEKNRLERLAKGLPPDHVARAAFFLGILRYEDGNFAEAAVQLSAFRQQFPKSPLAAEAALRLGFCQVHQKQFAEAQKTLQPLADKEPRLADQALLWIAKAKIGAADPANRAAHEQALKSAIDTLRQAAERANQRMASDPSAKMRRGEILLELADTQQTARQHKEAAAIYQQILNAKLLPAREEEVMQHLATAWHRAGDYIESEKVCLRFREAHPKSVLLPAVLFRYAENAYFRALNSEKLPNVADRTREAAHWSDEAIGRYRIVIEQYPEFPQINLARCAVGAIHYRKGELDKAKAVLEAIPAAERTGDLAMVSYQLADILLRQAPAKADDAIAAGKLEEQLKSAIELLEGFTAAQPNGPRTADALFKLGHCQQRMAALLAQPPERDKALAAARAAYEQIMQRFPKDSIFPYALFERAKVLARAKDVGGASNELRRFLSEPLKNTAIAPMALLHLSTLLRQQRNPQEAAKILAQCRQQHEANLLKDTARAAWVPLLQYHHGLALRESGKRREAKEIFDLIVRQSPGWPEAIDAALRAGQCLKEEGERKIAESAKRLTQVNLKPEERTAANKAMDDGIKDVRDSVQYFVTQAEQIRQKQPESEARVRMLYEAAWGSRVLAEREVESARRKIQQEMWRKRQDEIARNTPPGQPTPTVPPPQVTRQMVPLQPAEKEVRKHYRTLIEAFPDSALNADARFELAELLSERGEHDAAIALLREAIDKEPPPELTDKVRLRLGDCLLRKSDAKAALAQFEPIVGNAKSAMNAQARYRAGECYLHLKDAAAAVKQFAVFRDQPAFQNIAGLSDRALLRLGYALGLQKQWDASRQAYEQVVNRFGRGSWVHDARYGIGWAYQNQGQYDNAVNVYLQVVSSTATELAARAQLNIGLCRLAQKRYDEAGTAFLVVPFTYDYPHLSALALVEAARAFAENKQPQRAIPLLERVLRDHPGTDSAQAARQRLAELKKS